MRLSSPQALKLQGLYIVSIQQRAMFKLLTFARSSSVLDYRAFTLAT